MSEEQELGIQTILGLHHRWVIDDDLSHEQVQLKLEGALRAFSEARLLVQPSPIESFALRFLRDWCGQVDQKWSEGHTPDHKNCWRCRAQAILDEADHLPDTEKVISKDGNDGKSEVTSEAPVQSAAAIDELCEAATRYISRSIPANRDFLLGAIKRARVGAALAESPEKHFVHNHQEAVHTPGCPECERHKTWAAGGTETKK